MTKLRLIVMLAALALCTNAWAAADDDVFVKCSEKDPRTGKLIIPERNFKALGLMMVDAKLAKYSKDCKTFLTAAEQAEAQKPTDRKAGNRVRDLRQMEKIPDGNRTVPGVAADMARTKFGLDEDNFDPGFYVRDAYAVASLSSPLKARDRADGAQFSYRRDYLTNNDIFAATGAVIYWKDIDLEKDGVAPLGINRMLFAPGFEFDQQRNRLDPKKDVDYLGFRFIGELRKERAIPAEIFRYSAYYKTDTHGSSQIWGGFAEWEPIFLSWGIGGGHSVFGGPVMYSLQPTLHAEYEKVVRAGDLTNVASGDQYLRVGPILQANIWFLTGLLENLKFSAQYRYLWGVASTGNDKDRKYFQADAAYNIDKSGNIALGVTYRNGETPGNGTRVQDIKTGLTVKY